MKLECDTLNPSCYPVVDGVQLLRLHILNPSTKRDALACSVYLLRVGDEKIRSLLPWTDQGFSSRWWPKFLPHRKRLGPKGAYVELASADSSGTFQVTCQEKVYSFAESGVYPVVVALEKRGRIFTSRRKCTIQIEFDPEGFDDDHPRPARRSCVSLKTGLKGNER